MFSEEILKILQDNHRLVKVRGIQRREALARWSHIGTMTGLGTHQPSGGFKGSVYNPYACHSGETPEDLLALLRQALVCFSYSYIYYHFLILPVTGFACRGDPTYLLWCTTPIYRPL